MAAARYARIWRVDVLAGAGDIPWATLDHCFGASDDIPDLLRETAAGSEEALEELGGYMVHQGTLYLVTPYLVRFLARIAASGVATERILDLLGVVASFDDAGQAPEVRGGTRAALAEASTALSPLLGDPSDVVRDAAASALPQSLAADRLVRISRSAAPALIARLISVVAGDDPTASQSAILQLRELGALAQAADELAVVADAEGPSRRADCALTCLIQVGDPRCVPLLVRDQRHRPFALDALRGTGQAATRPPFTAALLEEVRACLREELLGDKATPVLIGLIGSWGPAAAAATPDLLEILPRHGYSVGCALADIAGATPKAVSLLRQAAAGGASLNAAARLRALTGDEQPLLTAIQSRLTQTRHALRHLTEEARTLTPARRLV